MTAVAEAPTINDEAMRRRMHKWVDRLRSIRIFRKLKVEAKGIDRDYNVSLTVHLTDGLVTISTNPLVVNIATMTWERLYELIEEDLVEVFRAHVRKMTRPELMLPGTVPVDVKDAETDGEEHYVY